MADLALEREQIAREAAERKEMEQFNKCTFSPALSQKSRNLNKQNIDIYADKYNEIFSYENILEKTKRFHQKFEEKIRNREVCWFIRAKSIFIPERKKREGNGKLHFFASNPLAKTRRAPEIKQL